MKTTDFPEVAAEFTPTHDEQAGRHRVLANLAATVTRLARPVTTDVVTAVARRMLPGEAALQLVLDATHDGVVQFNAQGRLLAANPAAIRMFGLDPALLGDVNFADLIHVRSGLPAGADLLRPGQGEAVACRLHGPSFPVDLHISEGVSGEPGRRFAIVRDMSERLSAESRLAWLANFDPLTGLPNRGQLRERLQQAMRDADAHGRGLVLMCLDLDRVRNVNDNLGLAAGDRLLQLAALAIGEGARSAMQGMAGMTLLVARLSSDEFAVMIGGMTDGRDADRIARGILTALARPHMVEALEVFISARIGITRYPQPSCAPETLMLQAERAMRRAKALGLDTAMYEHLGQATEGPSRIALEAGLRHALERDEFHLVYQPKVHAASGAVAGVEALLRWHPEGDVVIGPDRFIPILEETGLIVPVGTWVLQTACAQMVRWQRGGMRPLKLAVNLSARQFRQPDLVGTIERILVETGFDPTLLQLELTESMLLDDIDDVVVILDRLGAMGVGIAIDDFGTGHSSLNYLKRFHLDTLKIDRSFVRDTPTDSGSCAIANAVIALGHALGVKVVAEGVETEAQAEFLRRSGCDRLQGYLFSKPLPPQDLLRWVLQRQVSHRVDVEHQAGVREVTRVG